MLMLHFAAAAVCCLQVVVEGKKIYRLPDIATPLQYNLTLIVDPSISQFSGQISTDIYIKDDTHNLTLHSKELNIKEIILQDSQENSIVPTTFNLDPEADTLVVQSPVELLAEQHFRLRIDFEGNQTNGTLGTYGFFRVKSELEENDFMSASGFEMITAREAFPCWDEPHFKAHFLVSLVHPITYKALSNMPLDHSAPADQEGWVVDHFAKSPLMSTYLVAIHILKWEYLEIKAVDGRPLRLWASAAEIHQGQGHLEFSRTALSWLQNYTGIPDLMPKIDLVVVPSFRSALETWGDISFKPHKLLHEGDDPLEIPEVSSVVHELAHSWFGNLVTPRWWDNVWLSEGAATFFTALAFDEIFPTSNYLAQHTQRRITSTFYDTVWGLAEPLNPIVKHYRQLKRIPPNVYYQGCSLFHMLYHSLGPGPLREGIHRYLTTLQFGTATPSDLYEALDYQWGGRNLSELMEEWTYTAGVPIVTATRSGGQLILSQDRFSTKRSIKDPELNQSTKWWVPVSYTTQAKKDFQDSRAKLWFLEKKAMEDPAPEAEWLMLNIKASGMYIVKYDSNNFDMILKSLATEDNGGIPLEMRERLFLDYSLLYIADNLEGNELWRLFELLQYETEDGPWTIAEQTSLTLRNMPHGTPSNDMIVGQVLRLSQNRKPSHAL